MNERFARAQAIARVDLGHEPDFDLAGIRVRPSRREIAGESWREIVEPRVMRVLVALARAGGEMVTRDDLIESCWDGVIVGEDAIIRSVGRLRKVAEASGDAFRIETVPRVGYCLKIAQVPAAKVPEAPRPDSAVACTPPFLPPAQAKPSWLIRANPIAGKLSACLLVLLAAGFGLWWFWLRQGSAPTEPEASVAVLPFTNMSGDPSKEYFSDGFSEELLDDLSRDSRLHVAARTSAFAFKGRNENIETIAQALGVRALVEGSVREAGNRVRIAARLIDAHSGYNIWSATYDRNLSDILNVQDEVARAIAGALTQRIVPRHTFAPRSGKIDPAVYRKFLEAERQLNLVSQDGYTNAYKLLRQVVASDPDFAAGLAAFSRAAWGAAPFDPMHYDSMAAAAKEAAAKALWLDPGNVEAREMHMIYSLDAWDWRAAAAEIRILRSESPNDMRALAGLDIYYNFMGFPEAALAVLRHAQELDPLSENPRGLMLRNLLRTNRYREAIDAARAILAHRPDDVFALQILCGAYAYSGRIGLAREVYAHLKRIPQDSPEGCEFSIDVNSGDVAAARRILGTWTAGFPDKAPSATDIAEHYIRLNDFDRASDWFERAYGGHDVDIFESVYWPAGAKYRQTARWQALTQQPLFKQWQAEHDRIAAELAARGGVP